jgi:hypothetical protein
MERTTRLVLIGRGAEPFHDGVFDDARATRNRPPLDDKRPIISTLAQSMGRQGAMLIQESNATLSRPLRGDPILSMRLRSLGVDSGAKLTRQPKVWSEFNLDRAD